MEGSVGWWKGVTIQLFVWKIPPFHFICKLKWALEQPPSLLNGTNYE